MKRLVVLGLAFVAVIVAVYAFVGEALPPARLVEQVPISKPVGDDVVVFRTDFTKATALTKAAIEQQSATSIHVRLENADEKAGVYPILELPIEPFDSADVDAVVLTMKPSTGKTQPKLYWIREGETVPTADAVAPVRWAFDGKERRETIPVSQFPGWRGRIHSLRLMPTDTAADVEIKTVDGVRLAPRSTGHARVSVAAEVRDAIVASSDSTTSCEIEARSGSRLDFAVGVPDESWNRRGGPVTFAVRVNGKEQWRRAVDPRAKPEDRRWIEETLEPLPSGKVRIEFGFEFSKDDAYPRGAFGTPIVSSARPGRARHVVLLSLDTLRADHLGCYGYPKPTSPHIDALAAESIRFEQMIASAPETLESHMSLFTSMLPTAHGCYKSTHRLNPNIPTIASALRDKGFLTAGFVGNGFIASPFGFDQGFDRYDDGVARADNVKIDTARTFERALEFLGKNADRDTFTFVHTYEIHTPYAPSAESLKLFDDPAYDHRVGNVVTFFPDAVKLFADANDLARPEDVKHVVALYDGGIRDADAYVGKLLDGIAARHLVDSTLFVLLADHGEELMEHGTLANHGRSLYEELVHVPLIVRGPDLPSGKVVKGVVSHLDVGPTILEWVDLVSPRSFTGRSLLDAMHTGTSPNELVVSEDLTQFRRSSVRRATTKYVRTRNVEFDRFNQLIKNFPKYRAVLEPLYLRPKGEEFYDLVNDPNEQNDLAMQRQPSCDTDLSLVNQSLSRNWTARRAFGGSGHAEPTGADMKRLAAMGYIEGAEPTLDLEAEIAEEKREEIPRGQR
jgi:arylsulfatase A-like enzyme